MSDFSEIKERFDEALSLMSEQKTRMLEDLRFSNPSDPQQWDAKIRTARTLEAMPCYTFDQTNQYVAQVVNDSRMNKPQIQTVPASSGSDQKVSDVLDGMIRQIEYASDASIAYDVAQEAAARVGRGWFRLITEVVDPRYNLQELRIRPVIDCLSVVPGEYMMPDGSDMQFGFVETRISKDAYAAKYKVKAKKVSSWKDDGNWFDQDTLRIAEYFEIREKTSGNVVYTTDDEDTHVSADEYEEVKSKTGVEPKIKGTYDTTTKTVYWFKLNGNDFIEDSTTFPGQFIPLFPVHGYEAWIEGKRFLCGMVRRMMDSQRAYNIDRSAEIMLKTLQPKAPYLIPLGGVEGLEGFWKQANTSNQSYLPWNHVDENGLPIPPPQRIAPPQIGNAYIQGSQQSLSDLQASVGMYKANLGAPSNETSGVAIKRRETQGDTANFHYTDNLARSMGHCGRVIVGAIPTVYADSKYGKRDVRTLGIDGASNTVTIDPDQSKPYKRKDGDVTINLGTDKYDVRVKVGPAYANLREELSQRLTEISSGNPQLGAALAPLLVSMMDMPESDKVSKICLALLPPQVQAAYNTDGKKPEVPPEAMQQIQQLTQQLQQAHQALVNAADQHQQLEQQVQSKAMVAQQSAQAAAQLAQVKEQAQSQREAMQAQNDRQMQQDKAQLELVVQNAKHQRELDYITNKTQTSLAEKQHDGSIQLELDQSKSELAITLQSMKDASAKQTADITAMWQLLSKLVTPPPQVVQDAEAPSK